mmetsp:Transcript_2295/g.6866  ORF Transcript_2295/g.6866 Transcript_2295/m.6866 type:complete len:119 (+) Transcript_2295:100-456(+)
MLRHIAKVLPRTHGCPVVSFHGHVFRQCYSDDAAHSGKASGAMPERSEEAEFGVDPTTVSQTHPNVHMETPAQMDNKEAIKHLAPQVSCPVPSEISLFAVIGYLLHERATTHAIILPL